VHDLGAAQACSGRGGRARRWDDAGELWRCDRRPPQIIPKVRAGDGEEGGGRRPERAAPEGPDPVATGADGAVSGKIGQRPERTVPGAGRSGGAGSFGAAMVGIREGEVRDDMWGPLA
jgi:hypothetical protein